MATDIFFPIPSLIMFGVGIIGTILIVVDYVRQSRSVLVWIIGTPIAVFMLYWLLAEIVFPH